MNENEITIVELFAGVGGFRLGLEGDKKATSIYLQSVIIKMKLIILDFSNRIRKSI